jgi:general stress protein YciG
MKKRMSAARRAAYTRLRKSGHYSKIGKKGGDNNVAKHGIEHMSEIGEQGGQAMLKKGGKEYFRNLVAIRDSKVSTKGNIKS